MIDGLIDFADVSIMFIVVSLRLMRQHTGGMTDMMHIAGMAGVMHTAGMYGR